MTKQQEAEKTVALIAELYARATDAENAKNLFYEEMVKARAERDEALARIAEWQPRLDKLTAEMEAQA